MKYLIFIGYTLLALLSAGAEEHPLTYVLTASSMFTTHEEPDHYLPGLQPVSSDDVAGMDLTDARKSGAGLENCL